mmetsp:Transcript_19686/g.36221  ORF Transcript_19686/g.36221 Transcript_19686/m.36221 type:complete len:305 (+) Transcript_19686:2794-3708(+)
MKDAQGEVNRLFETNGLQLLRKELGQLQHDIKLRKLTLKTETERLSRLTSQLQLAKQQIDFYKAEVAKASSEARKTALLLTPDLAESLAHQQPPHPEVVSLSFKVLTALDYSETSWHAFTALLIDFNRFKSLLTSYKPEALRDEQLALIVSVWKNSQSLCSALEPLSPAAALLLLWLAHNIEFKLKLEALSLTQRKVPELERKVKSQVSIIGEQRSQVEGLEAKYSDQLNKIESAKSSAEQKSATESSTNSPPQEVTPTPRFPNEFPDFSSEELYNEKDTSMFTVQMEGAGEIVGCCRSKFFCF